jgi:signal recognition particle GTPase
MIVARLVFMSAPLSQFPFDLHTSSLCHDHSVEFQQARVFKEATDISGIVLTKLDGTAKGGVIIGIQEELGVPVRYIGVGEEVDDLQPFDASLFVQALFEK